MQISVFGQIRIHWSNCSSVSEVVCAAFCSWLRCSHVPSVFENISSLLGFLLECRGFRNLNGQAGESFCCDYKRSVKQVLPSFPMLAAKKRVDALC